MNNDNKRSLKIRILFSVLIILFSITLVVRTFQNDTFFNITIGKYILENGIDMKDHFSWIQGLDYTYSHWAFDITIYLVYKFLGFGGIYLFTMVFTSIISVTLFLLLCNKSKNHFISFIISIVTSVFLYHAFAARSQIISFLCFIVEIYCLEEFIDTKKLKCAITIIISSIVIANFHAASWPLTLILFLPYFAAELVKRFINKHQKYSFSKFIIKESYNFKGLIILFIIVCLTGLITPIHGVPYTYIIKSMTGTSNLEDAKSIDYIDEMKPLIPIKDIAFMLFTAILLINLFKSNTKLRIEHFFLLFGLYIMAFSSFRYTYLLMSLGSFVILDLLSQTIPQEKCHILEDFMIQPLFSTMLILFFVIYSSSCLLVELENHPYLDDEFCPVEITDYITDNLDYKNIRIYNQYRTGAFLMFNGIKPFIDSRLDVYCSEFADTEIFKDFVELEKINTVNYKTIFEKYDFTHLIIKKDSNTYIYIQNDRNYKKLIENDEFVLYEVL